MDFQYQIDNTLVTISLEAQADGSYRATIGDRVYHVRSGAMRPPAQQLYVDDQPHTAHVVASGGTRLVAVAGRVWELKKPDPRRARRPHQHSEDSLAAAMPGQVTAVLVAAGDHVERGQPLLILEAMKMEIKIAAPHAGHVAQLLVTAGQVVERGQALIELSADH